jgi:hypothetical protein
VRFGLRSGTGAAVLEIEHDRETLTRFLAAMAAALE